MQKIKDFIKYLLASLDNNNKGASGKKLTALAVTIAYCFAHKYCDSNNLTSVLVVDAGLITALFSVNTYAKIKTENESK